MGYHLVEARWEAFGDRNFFELDASPVIGDLDLAQAVAENYLTTHVSSVHDKLQWLAGIPDKNGPVYYANNPFITFRIRR